MVGFDTNSTRTNMKTTLYHITKIWIRYWEDIVFKRNLLSLPFSSHLTAFQLQNRPPKHQIQFVWIDPQHLNMCWNCTTVQTNSIIFNLSSLFLFSFLLPPVFGCTSYFIGGGFQTLKRKVAVQLLLLLLLGQLLVILQLAAMAGNNSKIFYSCLLS